MFKLIKDPDIFLDENFKGLTLKRPLFYNWEFGLRFDLQPNAENPVSTNNDEYFEFVQSRAKKLFESAFGESDELFLILYQYKWTKRTKIRRGNFVFKQIKGFKQTDVQYSVKKYLYEDGDKNDIWNKAIIKLNVNQLDYAPLLKALSHTDFPNRKPSISLESYFLNISKKLIFNMYDDRGLDIISADKKSLTSIYEEYNDWILDYDRVLMEERMNK